jgi:hypothetical protein
VADSPLNSIHLTADRREAFREARRALLEGRGAATQQFEAGQLAAFAAEPGATQASTTGQAPAATGLALVDGEKTYPLHVGVNTVGRFPDNHVVINNPHVSRRHCAILVHAGERCELCDTASKNGTYVNGQRITGPTPLNPGDEILLHTYRIILVKENDPRCQHTFYVAD